MTVPTVSDDYPEDPVRTEDRETLERITAFLDEHEEALNDAILHPHAVLDTAFRRSGEMGFADNDNGTLAAIMGMWTDGFMVGQRAMAQALGIDLDADPLDDPDDPRNG